MGQKRKTSIWIKGLRISSYEFSINILIGSGDNYSFVAIMILPNEWCPFLKTKKPPKALGTRRSLSSMRLIAIFLPLSILLLLLKRLSQLKQCIFNFIVELV